MQIDLRHLFISVHTISRCVCVCPLDSVDTKVTASRLVAPRKEQSGQSYRSNRFGFRHANIVRPTSTGLQPKVSEDFEEDLNNNHTTGRERNLSGHSDSE